MATSALVEDSVGCGCGCGEMSVVSRAEDCSCGCECCGSAQPKSPEQEIAELRVLRESIDRRLSELEQLAS